MLRFADDTFTESYISTIGVDFKIRTLSIDGYEVKLQIWDTSGQERFRTITSSYYRGASAILLVYDISDSASFSEIEYWNQEVTRYAAENVLRVLVGNKCDLESYRQVATSVAQDFASSMNISFMETSAKTGQNVNQLFNDLASNLLKRRLNSQ
uniref:Uncharacterized protein n=1 Tax=Arcella intermedia TaxID=1963864 RepID=A0A6B2LL81_9EUKA